MFLVFFTRNIGEGGFIETHAFGHAVLCHLLTENEGVMRSDPAFVIVAAAWRREKRVFVGVPKRPKKLLAQPDKKGFSQDN